MLINRGVELLEIYNHVWFEESGACSLLDVSTKRVNNLGV
jgi:hypothetical protein